MTFKHINLDLCPLERETIEGVRYYTVPDPLEQKKLVSITSITSHYNRAKFAAWRRKVGEEKANNITRKATARGTDTHTLVEHYLNNEDKPKGLLPISEQLFSIGKADLNRINNIYSLEGPLWSNFLGIAGTVDCIAEFDGELSIIDFKTSKEPKPREWIDNYFVQCAAYACMLYELKQIPVKKFVILMMCENGDCAVYEEYNKEKYIRLLTQYIRKFVNDKLEQFS